MNDSREIDRKGEDNTERAQSPEDGPQIVRLEDWLRRKQSDRAVKSDDDFDGHDPDFPAA